MIQFRWEQLWLCHIYLTFPSPLGHFVINRVYVPFWGLFGVSFRNKIPRFDNTFRRSIVSFETGLLVKFKHLHWQLTIDIRILEHIRALLNKYIERTKLIHSFIYSQWYNCFRWCFYTIDSFQCHYTEYVCFPCLKIIFHTINYATGALTLAKKNV